MTTVKVLRTVAFTDLASEIKRFQTMLRSEAEKMFGAELVAQAIRQRVCAAQDTKLGNVLFLLHLGRHLVGVAGAFQPTEDALMNAICLRDIGQRLEHAGIEIDLTVRKRSLVYSTSKKRVLVLAQHNGYWLTSLRKVYRDFVVSGEFSQLQLFTYLTPAEIAELTGPLYDPPRKSAPIAPAQLPVYGLPLPKRKRIFDLPAGVLD